MRKTILLFAALLTVGMAAQDKATPLTPTEAEMNKLVALQKDVEIKARDIQIAQLQYKQLLDEFNNSKQVLIEEGKKVAAAHKWDVNFDPQALSFTPKPTPKTEEPPKPTPPAPTKK